MLQHSVIEDTDIVTATYEGSLSTEEMAEMRDSLEWVVAERGSAKLLVELGDIDLGRIEPKAVWEDLKTVGQLDDVSRFALVTDKGWIQKVGETADSLTSADIEIFGADERDEALVWLRS